MLASILRLRLRLTENTMIKDENEKDEKAIRSVCIRTTDQYFCVACYKINTCSLAIALANFKDPAALLREEKRRKEEGKYTVNN